MKHSAALRAALAEVSLFSLCSRRDLQIISRHMQVVAVDEGTAFIREGDDGDAFYISLEGSASVERGSGVVGGVWPGDHAGELALLDPSPRSATVVARTPMVLGVLDRRAFLAILRDVPSLNTKLFQAMARRLRERDAQAPTR